MALPGACQVGGTVIDWMMKAEGVSFRHAVELLQNDYSPLAADSGAAPAKRSTVKKLAMPLERDAEDAKLTMQMVRRFSLEIWLSKGPLGRTSSAMVNYRVLDVLR